MIAGVAFWSLLGGTTLAQEQVLIFQDTFEVSEAETTDLGFENDERQSGALGATTYSDSSEDLTVINSEWAPGKLSLFPGPASEWVAVSPDHNFAFGSPFTIEFEVDAGVDDEDNASGDWAAIVFGAKSKNSWVISADGFGILFRNNGDIQVFDGGDSIYGVTAVSPTVFLKDDLEFASRLRWIVSMGNHLPRSGCLPMKRLSSQRTAPLNTSRPLVSGPTSSRCWEVHSAAMHGNTPLIT